MRIAELLAEGYRETVAAFSQAADLQLVKRTVEQYRDLVNRNQVQGQQRNIDWWRSQGWSKFLAFVNDRYSQPSKRQLKTKRAVGHSITLHEDDQWLVVIPLDHAASCFHGRGSEWCTARPTSHYFDDYFLDRDVVLIYCINKTSGLRWAIASHKDTDEIEIFDQQDETIDAEQFHTATGLSAEQLVADIPHNNAAIQQAKEVRRAALTQIRRMMADLTAKKQQGDRNQELETLLTAAKHPILCQIYMENVYRSHGAQRFPHEIVMASIGASGHNIRFVTDPTAAEQMAAVKADSNSIRYIRDPVEAVQLAAIATSAQNFILMLRQGIVPSETVQIAAVKLNGSVVNDIVEAGIEPSETVQITALTHRPSMVAIENLYRHQWLSSQAVIAVVESHNWTLDQILEMGWQFSHAELHQLLSKDWYLYRFQQLVKNHVKLSDDLLITAITAAKDSVADGVIKALLDNHQQISHSVQTAAVTKTPKAFINMLLSGVEPCAAAHDIMHKQHNVSENTINLWRQHFSKK